MDFGDDLGDPYQYQIYAPNESPGARQRRVQKERRDQTEKQQMMEILISTMICFYLIVNLLFYQSEYNCGNFKTWMIWSLFFYIFDLIVALNQLMFIMKKGRESIWYHLAMYIVLIGNTSWYIYGNTIYYPNAGYCGQEVNPDSCAKMT